MKTPRWLAVLVCLVVLGSVGTAASLRLIWQDNSDNESGFRVERAIGTDGEFVLYAEVGANVESYVDELVTPGLVHRYRVAAWNSAGQSAYSNEASAVADPVDPLPDGPGASLQLSFITEPSLINISGRGQVGVGPDVHIGGFVVSAGEGRLRVLIRGIGPTMGEPPFNVPGVLEDPKLTLFSDQQVIAENDNWGGDPDIRAAAQSVFAFNLPDGSADAALLVELEPGSYTVHLDGVNETTGVALLEIYAVPVP